MEDGRTLDLRRITIRLDQATRDGDMELHLLTNLPREKASAMEIADRNRSAPNSIDEEFGWHEGRRREAA